MDKIFLEYYGSAVGIDAIAALEEQRVPSEAFSSKALQPACNENDTSTNSSNCGHPIIPSNLLTEIWKNVGSIAGHEQHDVHEFFQAFLDCLPTHTLSYQKSAREMRQFTHQTQIKHMPASGHNHANEADEGDTANALFSCNYPEY